MLTWFGWTVVICEILVLAVTAANDKQEPWVRSVAVLFGLLYLAGVLFVGTGHI